MGKSNIALLRDAQTAFPIDETAGETVAEWFGSLSSVSICASEESVDDSVEEQLADLWYVR